MDDCSGSFEGQPFSPKANKTGDGLSIVVGMSNNEFIHWTKLAAARGQNIIFDYRLSPSQPDHPTDPT